MTDVRDVIVEWARWGVKNRGGFTYTEGPERMSGVHRPGILPCFCDCSASCTYWFSWAGAADPNGLKFDGEGYCHEPGARILTADLRWAPAADITEGDELWAFEETPANTRIGRTFQRATVLESFRSIKESVRVTIDDGESFVCSWDHPWLSTPGRAPGQGQHGWTQARDLLGRPELVRPFIPWVTEDNYDAGWLAGMFDGEGWARRKGARGGRTDNVGVTQVLGPTADKLQRLCLERGEFRYQVKDRPPNQKRMELISLGGFDEAAAIIGSIRAERLIGRFEMAGGRLKTKHPARVVSVERVGRREVQSIRTTTGTYLAEGFAVHNTGTELGHGQHIPLWRKNGHGVLLPDVIPADMIVYGPGTGWHIALVVDFNNGDPWTVSMGRPGDPRFVKVSDDGRQPQTYLRFDTTAVNPIYRPGQSLIVPKLIRAGSPASFVDQKYRPAGIMPTLVPHGAHNPPEAVQWLRRCLNHARGTGPKLPPTKGGYGTLTADKVRAFKHTQHLAPEAVVGGETWDALGIPE